MACDADHHDQSLDQGSGAQETFPQTCKMCTEAEGGHFQYLKIL